MSLQAELADFLESTIGRAREGLRFRPLMQSELTLVRSLGHAAIDELSARYPVLMKMELGMLDNLKSFLRKALPVIEAVAAVTPNQLDDQAVAFLKAWLASGNPNIESFAATYQP